MSIFDQAAKQSLPQDGIPHNNQLSRQYSTFIDQLEQTTEKLMNQVWGADEIQDNQDRDHLFDAHNHNSNSNHRHSQYAHNPYNPQIPAAFNSFLTRNNHWQSNHQHHLTTLTNQQQQLQSSQIRSIPKILRGSKVEQPPIYQRCLLLQESKDKKIGEMRVVIGRERDRMEEQGCTFRPVVNNGWIGHNKGTNNHKTKNTNSNQNTTHQHINSGHHPNHSTINNHKNTMKASHARTQATWHQSQQFHISPQRHTNQPISRTLAQYLQDKQVWLHKKEKTIEQKRLFLEARKYQQCTFRPTLVAKGRDKDILLKERVEDRLLRSLEK